MLSNTRITAQQQPRRLQIYSLEHAPFEGPDAISMWATNNSHHLTSVPLYAGAKLPSLAAVDFLIIMGGPMSVHDITQHPWLQAEKMFLKQILTTNKPILGICLGAQLLADVMGAQVHKNHTPEIGWFPILPCQDPAVQNHPIGRLLPQPAPLLHWHGDRFAIPDGMIRLAYSQGCDNQAFSNPSGTVVGLQFHPEVTPDGLNEFVKHAQSDLRKQGQLPFVQSAKTILATTQFYVSGYALLATILDTMTNLAYPATTTS